jgi:hypothetical protein
MRTANLSPGQPKHRVAACTTISKQTLPDLNGRQTRPSYTSTPAKRQFDSRGNGCCFAPPTTIIRDGEEHSYRWLKFPWETKLACLPFWLVDILNAQDATKQAAQRPANHPSNDTSIVSKVKAKQTITTELSSQQATSSIEAEKAIQVATQLLQSRCNNQTSFYRGIKLRDGEAILKFRVKESRICPYGEEHTRNSFGIVCNGICMEYRCLSSGCKERPRVLLGLHHCPSLLISKSRFDLRPIQEAERIILRAKSTMDKVHYQQICQQLTQIAIRTMNY